MNLILWLLILLKIVSPEGASVHILNVWEKNGKAKIKIESLLLSAENQWVMKT